MCSYKDRFTIVILALLIYSFLMVPTQLISDGFSSIVYGEANHSFEINVREQETISQGESVAINYEITNLGSEVVLDKISLDYSPWVGITIAENDRSTYILGSGDTITCIFYITIAKDAPTGIKYGNLTLSYQDRIIYQTQRGRLSINQNSSSNGQTSTEPLEVSISYNLKPASGFSPGNGNEISFEFINSGDFSWENTYAELTLPSGFGIYNSSKANRIGMLYKGTRKSIKFPIYMEETVTGNYCFLELTLSGQKGNGQSVSLKKSFYIPIKNKESSNIINNFTISNVEIPNQVMANEDFKLTFEVNNRGSESVKNVRVSCEVPDGLLNKTRNTFVERTFDAGSKKQYSINLYSEVETIQSFPIKITVEALDAKEVDAVTQYANVFVNKNKEKDHVQTPQLMISAYSYGGSYVQAGTKFRLNLTLQNTSRLDVSNIKVTLGSDGTFIPINSSNSFFLGNLGKKQQTSYSVMLSVKPDAKQGTSAMDISMSYEDGEKEFTSKDTITIPVMQESRLAVDEVMQPMDLYAGNPAGVSVQFYNMGKTTLNNLRVAAHGDFDTMESIKYYVGNMEPGKSDSYDFALIPRQEGLMEGAVVFTYEDAGGKEQTYEVPFEFRVMGQMPVFGPDPGFPMEEQKPKRISLWVWIVGGVAIMGVVCGVLIRKRQRKKKQMELEMDE